MCQHEHRTQNMAMVVLQMQIHVVLKQMNGVFFSVFVQNILYHTNVKPQECSEHCINPSMITSRMSDYRHVFTLMKRTLYPF